MAIDMSGLDGRNPLAYFAAIGALTAADRVAPQMAVRLSWAAGPIPRPVLHGITTMDQLVDLLEADRKAWRGSVALDFPGHDDVKFDAATQREYLQQCRSAEDEGRSAALAAALIAEGVFAHTGDGKPTDFHFTAGQQKFLTIARELRDGLQRDDLVEALAGPWRYSREMKTFGWDVSDDRIYALSASNPSKERKLTVPGADWLALLGLVAYPVVRSGQSASPPGVSGTWKRGRFTWSVWDEPLHAASVCALIATGWSDEVRLARVGLFRQYSSPIRRSEQGGYGSFGPPSVHWERPVGAKFAAAEQH
jgi:hypothetical protein